jgi:hypothetical protein
MDSEIIRNMIQTQSKIGPISQEWAKAYNNLSASNAQSMSTPNTIYTNPSMFRGVNLGFAQYNGN